MVRAKKSLGQNFLMHEATAARIAGAAGLTDSDAVLEIGPGTGMLTRVLLAHVAKVIAVEADRELAASLAETFACEREEGKFVLIEGDIRAFDPTEHFSGPYKIVANIPYYLTGELMRRFLEARMQPESITFLVQKEVAERIARSKKGSVLSLSVKAFGTPRYAFTVPRGAFKPSPKVDSAVLTITHISRDAFDTPAQEARFFALIHAGFSHKRKLLASNLQEAGLLGRDTLASHGIPMNARAEDLPLDAWLALAGA